MNAPRMKSLSISAEGKIVMLVKRKSSHSQRLVLEPILSQCVDHPQNFANRYKRKQENSLCLAPDIILIWINIAQQVACQFSFENKTINYVRYGHLPRVTPTLPTVAGSSGTRT
jgi:hypothetical protein